MRTLLGALVIVAAAALAWGHSEYQRAVYFATRADSWETAYTEEVWQSENCVIEDDGNARPDLRKRTCFIPLPPEQQ